jgi:hypothetical protein
MRFNFIPASSRLILFRHFKLCLPAVRRTP